MHRVYWEIIFTDEVDGVHHCLLWQDFQNKGQQKARGGRASLSSSQEERKGTLQLQLSQPKDKEVKTQRLLNFQPVQRTLDNFAMKADQAGVQKTQNTETSSGRRGHGSQNGTSPFKDSTLTGTTLLHLFKYGRELA